MRAESVIGLMMPAVVILGAVVATQVDFDAIKRNEEAKRRPVQGDQSIFNSPIVLYAWDQVVEALETAGVVRKKETRSTSSTPRSLSPLSRKASVAERILHDRITVFALG